MDKRQQIFKKIALANGYCTDKSVLVCEDDLKLIYEAMDENGHQMCLDLLEYMARKGIICYHDEEGFPLFKYKGIELTKEQVFESFL